MGVIVVSTMTFILVSRGCVSDFNNRSQYFSEGEESPTGYVTIQKNINTGSPITVEIELYGRTNRCSQRKHRLDRGPQENSEHITICGSTPLYQFDVRLGLVGI